MTAHKLPEGAIYLPANSGRKYHMGKMQAIFKADEAETGQRYCISEWWLEPHTLGPGAHSHDKNDDMFYVLEGTASILVGDEWIQASKGDFVLIPVNTMHDFKNETTGKVGLLNIFIPGGFERNMPAVVRWFAENR
jgi:mannose-6-phosphate isomerase-like protein (cupin superfamily)